MEPNNQKPNDPKKPLPPEGRPTYEDFHAEGIDIVTDSGISEENEFTMKETEGAARDVLKEIAKAENVVPEQVPQKPLTPDQATKISNLQEIPRSEMFVPKKPGSFQPAQQVPTPMPSFASFQRPAEPKPPEAQNDPSIKQLRTFKSDAEEAVRYQNVSVVDIALAEQKKREADTKIQYEDGGREHHPIGIFIIVVMSIIVALLAGWYFWFTTSTNTPKVTEELANPKLGVSNIIPYTTGAAHLLSPQDNPIQSIATRLSKVSTSSNATFAILPKWTDEDLQPVEMADLMRDTEIPDGLLRSFSNTYMFGSLIKDGNGPFVLLKTISFPNSFSGMLEWERDMVSDLLPLIAVSHPTEDGTGTTTKVFEDSVISNTDVRLTRDVRGNVVLGYAFINKDTVAIAMSETALKYVIAELQKVRTIQ